MINKKRTEEKTVAQEIHGVSMNREREHSSTTSSRTQGMGDGKKIFLFAFIALFIILGVGFGSVKVIQSFGGSSSSLYSAVFLDNSQVYFGKVGNMSRDFMKVTDVYYFGSPSTSDGVTSSDVTLVKLGSEVHAPTDEMRINRDHILYIEELQVDSRVVKAIYEYKN